MFFLFGSLLFFFPRSRSITPKTANENAKLLWFNIMCFFIFMRKSRPHTHTHTHSCFNIRSIDSCHFHKYYSQRNGFVAFLCITFFLEFLHFSSSFLFTCHHNWIFDKKLCSKCLTFKKCLSVPFHSYNYILLLNQKLFRTYFKSNFERNDIIALKSEWLPCAKMKIGNKFIAVDKCFKYKMTQLHSLSFYPHHRHLNIFECINVRIFILTLKFK